MTLETADLILQSLEHVREDLRTLRGEVKAGFEKVNGRLGKLEDRVTALEKWQGEVRAVDNAHDRSFEQTQLRDHVKWSSKQVFIAGAALLVGSVSASIAILTALHIS
jgi:hypothetical protein